MHSTRLDLGPVESKLRNYFLIYLFCDMYVYAHTQHCVHVEVKDNILESVISFHHVSPKDQAQVGHQD